MTFDALRSLVRVMPTLSEDLLANPENPRHVSAKKMDVLRNSMMDLGDVSVICKNTHPDGGGMLISGHQRAEVLKRDPNAEVIITKHYAEPTRTGTTAEGYILSCGETFGYREVYWDQNKAKLASLVSNNHAGVYDEAQLVSWIADLDAAGIDLDTSLFDEEEWSSMLPEQLDEIPEPADYAPAPARPEAPSTPREPPSQSAATSEPAPRPPEPHRPPLPEVPQGSQIKQVQLFYTERDHAEFLRMVTAIQSKFGSKNMSEAVMEAVQQTSEA